MKILTFLCWMSCIDNEATSGVVLSPDRTGQRDRSAKICGGMRSRISNHEYSRREEDRGKPHRSSADSDQHACRQG